MAGLSDDHLLALAVLRLCDAWDEPGERTRLIALARKSAHAVLDRNHRTPEPENGITEGTD